MLVFFLFYLIKYSVQSLSHVRLWDPMDCSTPGFPVLHCLPAFTQTHVHWIDEATNRLILCRPFSRPVFPSISVFQCVTSSHQVAKVCVCCVCVVDAPHHVAHRVLFPWLGIEPVPLAVKAQSPNHWTTREFFNPLTLVFLRIPCSSYHSAPGSLENHLTQNFSSLYILG